MSEAIATAGPDRLSLWTAPTVRPGFGNWFAGFSDGEGCFDIHAVGATFICRFTIGLRADDRHILEEIQRELGLGSLTVRRTKPPVNPQVAWSVTRKHEVPLLVDVFDAYPLRSKKARDYVVWREAALLWSSLKRGSRWHGRNPRFARLGDLSKELRAGREFSNLAGDSKVG